jgi:hypothetical protein
VAEPPAVPAMAPASPTLLRLTVCAETLSDYFPRSLCARFFHHSTGKNWDLFCFSYHGFRTSDVLRLSRFHAKNIFLHCFLRSPRFPEGSWFWSRQKQHRIPNLHLGKLVLRQVNSSRVCVIGIRSFLCFSKGYSDLFVGAEDKRSHTACSSSR